MNKKQIFGLMLAFLSVVNPGCKHDHQEDHQIQKKHLKNRVITPYLCEKETSVNLK